MRPRRRLAPVFPLGETSENLYILLVLDNWKLIAAVTFLAVVATYILTKTVMTKWYQATAVIEPIPEGAVENRVEGGMGGLGGAGMSTFLMVTGMDSQAQEYLTILRSFTFNTRVALTTQFDRRADEGHRREAQHPAQTGDEAFRHPEGPLQRGLFDAGA